jgi:hypothetical protein
MNQRKPARNIQEETDYLGVAAAMEAKRLAEKYQKDSLDSADLTAILGVGEANARRLMNSRTFLTLEIGNRKVVTVLNFTLWQVRQTEAASA